MVDRDVIRLRQKTVGSYLRRARVAANLTQKTVAMKLGYSTSQFVSNWERGYSAPPPEALATLVKLYRLDADSTVAVFRQFGRQVLELQSKALSKTLRAGA